MRLNDSDENVFTTSFTPGIKKVIDFLKSSFDASINDVENKITFWICSLHKDSDVPAKAGTFFYGRNKKAFANFDIQEVACFTDSDVQRLLLDSGIVRNKGKIKAIIQNAQNFVAIEKRYGSFQKYLDSFDKSDNYANATKELVNYFKWLGPPSASLFLYTVGEKIDPW